MIFAAALLTAALTTRAQYLMGTVCEISAPETAPIDAAFAEGARIEAMISTWRDDSELSRLNRGLARARHPERADAKGLGHKDAPSQLLLRQAPKVLWCVNIPCLGPLK